MHHPIGIDDVAASLSSMGLAKGDIVLARASLKAVGNIKGGGGALIDGILKAIGDEGTLVSLAFTDSSFLFKPKLENAFDITKKSNAGGLPNIMLKSPAAKRSRHPTCSYVAIGRDAEAITGDHDETSSAYEPVRKIIELNGKCLLVGCVGTSPGFTTTHVAEADLGLMSRVIFPKLNSTYYKTNNGKYKIFRRPDLGSCSQSFCKFYGLYVKHGILATGMVGEAYSILAPARRAYEIDYDALKHNPKLNTCNSPTCMMCNARRWDNLHKIPSFVARYLFQKMKSR